MAISLTERRQIENEMIFRRINEKVGADLDTLDAMHIEDGNRHLVRDDDIELHFQCECSDENCNARIPIKLSIYKQIHINRDSFIVKLKHQVKSIEDVVLSEANYSVVKKKHSTPEPNDILKVTTIDNSMH
ncbi:MAG: hypothetical protein JWM07_654 [Candidatus Saccharibacteria bacterium]|jgi:uncharacterized protein (UPF0216 family)|nr:hypothetical protein [Candidatus Saccharibacteria bacterium]